MAKLAFVKRVLESTIEAELKRRVEATGGICEKVRAIGRRGFFDRIIILPGPRIIFCEVKRPRGGRVAPHQNEYASRYEALGVPVAIVRNREDIDALLKS
jgi:nucleoside-triphosphatase THEP1